MKTKFQGKAANLVIEKVCLIAKQKKIKVCFLVEPALRFAARLCDCFVSGDNLIHRHCFQDSNTAINAVPVNVS